MLQLCTSMYMYVLEEWTVARGKLDTHKIIICLHECAVVHMHILYMNAHTMYT